MPVLASLAFLLAAPPFEPPPVPPLPDISPLAPVSESAPPGPSADPLPPPLPVQTTEGLTIAGIPFGAAELASAEQTFDPSTGQPTIQLNFTEAGSRKIAALTRRHAPREVLEIRIDGAIVSEPFLMEPIDGPALTIAGSFSLAEAKALAARLDGHGRASHEPQGLVPDEDDP